MILYFFFGFCAFFSCFLAADHSDILARMNGAAGHECCNLNGFIHLALVALFSLLPQLLCYGQFRSALLVVLSCSRSLQMTISQNLWHIYTHTHLHTLLLISAHKCSGVCAFAGKSTKSVCPQWHHRPLKAQKRKILLRFRFLLALVLFLLLHCYFAVFSSLHRFSLALHRIAELCKCIWFIFNYSDIFLIAAEGVGLGRDSECICKLNWSKIWFIQEWVS